MNYRQYSKLKPNKATGMDGLPSEILEVSSNYIGPLLVKIISLFIRDGIFPECLKTAKVRPLYKSDDPQDMTNYRSISLLPIVSKALERVVYNRMNAFLERFGLLSDSQYGSRCKRSTIDAILSITEGLRGKSKVADKSVFLDLSKAFDTLDHSISLVKLKKIGFRGNFLKWFNSCLSNRKQCVV